MRNQSKFHSIAAARGTTSRVDTIGVRKNILVTGGVGFLGSHLCQRLLGHGHSVVCLDNLSSGNLNNLSNFIRNPDFMFIKHDIVQPYATNIHFDQIYNLACPASPPYYQADPIQTMKTNVIGTINVLDLARRQGARVFQASTSEIYGDPTVHPQTESYLGNVNPIGPRACYDEGKRAAETLCFDYARCHGVEIRVARIFNTYGPRMRPDDGRVVSNFIVQALLGHDLTIYGDGSQTRSFCYVEDLIDGIVSLTNKVETPETPVNLGNPHEYTMADLAGLIIDLAGSNSKVVHLPLPVDDPKRRRPDISFAIRQLGWTPKVELKEGLRDTVAFFEDVLHRRNLDVMAPDFQSQFSARSQFARSAI